MVIQLQCDESPSGLTRVVELASPVRLHYLPAHDRSHAVRLIGREHAIKSSWSPHGRRAKNVRGEVGGLYRERPLSCKSYMYVPACKKNQKKTKTKTNSLTEPLTKIR